MKNDSIVFDFLEREKVFHLLPRHLMLRTMTKEEMIGIFDHFGAFWQYEGAPSSLKPHALLKSGLHSNGFISCKDVLQYPRICDLFANEIVKSVSQNALEIEKVDVVVSSAYSAISLGLSIAKILSDIHNEAILYIPVEKDEKGNPTIIRGGIDPSKRVLIINELMTTGNGSTWETKKAVLECNGGNPPPIILEPSYVLVHRSKDYELPDGSKIKPIFHFDIQNFEPNLCPYCKAGSPVIKPKAGNNWNILHGRI